jgi:hypothetical protein
LAGDPAREERGVPHALVFKWQSGTLSESEANFDAHSICYVTVPEPAVVFLSEAGEYGVHSRSGSHAGDILASSKPKPKNARHGGFRAISNIDGCAYAVGYRGMVYRLESFTSWKRIDDGLPYQCDIEAVDGFGEKNLFLVGAKGQMWKFDGASWTNVELPTNGNLNAVKCCGDGSIVAAGDSGLLLRGRSDQWELIDQQETDDDFWDIEWFKGKAYISTLKSVYVLDGGRLEPLDFGKERPGSCYQLSVANNVMWSNGEFDIVSFDGSDWRKIV